MLGPHQSPIYFSMNWSHKFHCFRIMRKKKTLLLIKIKRDRRLFENQSGIKTVWKKIRFLKFIWKIGVSKITWKSEFWKLNLRIGILDIKFKRNWNFEN